MANQGPKPAVGAAVAEAGIDPASRLSRPSRSRSPRCQVSGAGGRAAENSRVGVDGREVSAPRSRHSSSRREPAPPPEGAPRQALTRAFAEAVAARAAAAGDRVDRRLLARVDRRLPARVARRQTGNRMNSKCVPSIATSALNSISTPSTEAHCA
jgi:hypothetical protein